MKSSARMSLVVGSLVASVGWWSAPTLAASFADLPPDWGEVALLNDRLRVRAPKAAAPAPPGFGLMEAPAAPEHRLRLIIDSGPLRLVALVAELFRVSPGGLAQLGPAFLKTIGEDRRIGPLSVAPSATGADGLEVLEYEPRGAVKLGDANFIRGVLTKLPDGTVQSINFFVNDPALADLPAARRLIADMIASLKPGSRPLLTGMRAQPPGGTLTLDLLPGYTAYWQRGPDFDVYWIEHLVPLNQPSGRLGIYSGHHPQRGRHPDNARMQRVVLFGVAAQWYVWEGPANLTNAPRFFLEAFVPESGTRLMRHVFLEAITAAESADFQRMAESATFQ